MDKKIVIVSTSAGYLKGEKTGVWLDEIAAPYLAFRKAGYDITVASPAGGAIPIDAGSLGEGFLTDDGKTFMLDSQAIDALCHSVKLETLEFPADFDCIFLPGGHGTCVDFVSNPVLAKAVESMNNAGKLVSSVCHGPTCLVECKTADGDPFVKGRTVTGFSDHEEAAVGKTDHVPFSIEAKFEEQGATYEKADDWNPKVCVDGNLITGQNPASSEPVAEAVIKYLAAL